MGSFTVNPKDKKKKKKDKNKAAGDQLDEFNLKSDGGSQKKTQNSSDQNQKSDSSQDKRDD